MKIHEITIHNFRSISDEAVRLEGYSLLIGSNNSGKSNFLDALRIFYEKDLKFVYDRDFPMFPTTDQESWIDIEYQLAPDEADTLKAEYRTVENRFRVRKWLHPTDKAKEGIYGYERSTLSEDLFYGWKNVSQGKLGDVIYIPAVSHRISASYTTAKAPAKKKEFSPEFALLLFEEPEAFLHPPQQEILNNNLQLLAVQQPGRQVIIATHSPLFVSYNTDEIANLVKFAKVGPKTQISQIDQQTLTELFESNRVVQAVVAAAVGEDQKIVADEAERELEAVRHFLWLNPERS